MIANTPMPPQLQQGTEALLRNIPDLQQGISAEELEAAAATSWLWWCLLAGGLILATVVAYVVYRRHRNTPPPPVPEEIALAALDAMQTTTPPDLRECSLELSMIFRQYLTGKTQDPALYETHEEFSRRLDSLSTIPAECQAETRQLLDYLASLKYAGAQGADTGQALQLIEATRQAVIHIHEAQQQALAAAIELKKVRKQAS